MEDSTEDATLHGLNVIGHSSDRLGILFDDTPTANNRGARMDDAPSALRRLLSMLIAPRRRCIGPKIESNPEEQKFLVPLLCATYCIVDYATGSRG